MPKRSPFLHFFGTFQNLFFSLKLDFLNIHSQLIVFNTFRNFDAISGVKIYIRTFHVISEVLWVPGLTLLLASWLSWLDLAKFLLHLGNHGSHRKILIKILLR